MVKSVLLQAEEKLEEVIQARDLLERIEKVSGSLKNLVVAGSLLMALIPAIAIIADYTSLSGLFTAIATGTALSAYATHGSRKKREEIRNEFNQFVKNSSPEIREVMTPIRNLLMQTLGQEKNLIDKGDFDLQNKGKLMGNFLTGASFLFLPPIAPAIHFSQTSARERIYHLITEKHARIVNKQIIEPAIEPLKQQVRLLRGYNI